MAEDEVCAPREAGPPKAQDHDKALFYKGFFKAARLTIMGKERFFVIPDNTEIWELACETSLEISDEVMAQTPTWEKALLMAYVLNYRKLKMGKVDSDG
jgi:hypothetical protein